MTNIEQGISNVEMKNKLYISVTSVSLWCILLVIAPSLVAVDTGRIEGRVVDDMTGKPLPFSNVTIEGTGMGAVTNMDGHYWILNITPGIFTLQARFVGYEDIIQSNVRVNKDQTTVVNFSLVPAVIQINEEYYKPVRIKYNTEDDVQIVGAFFRSPKHIEKSSGVILLHMLSRNRNDWNVFAKKLQNSGFFILTIDLRGHGESTQMGEDTLDFRNFSKEDYQGMLLDAKGAVEFIENQRDFSTENLIIIGASIGGNIALNYAVTDERVKGVVLLSAGLDYRGIKTEEAMKEYGDRPILIVASEEDKYAYQSAKKLYEVAQGEKEMKIY
jgi:dienelactone hydrolase